MTIRAGSPHLSRIFNAYNFLAGTRICFVRASYILFEVIPDMLRTNLQRSGGKYYTRYLAHYAKKNHVLLVLGAIFLSGAFLGTILVGTASGDMIEMLLRVVNGFIENRRGQTLLRNIVSTASSSLTFVTILFVCGFCAISQPLTLALPFIRGLGFGFSAGSLYARYGAAATGFVSLFILPDMLISSVAILLCCKESLRLSGGFLRVAAGGALDEAYPVRIYIGRYIAAAVLCVFSAFLESVLYFVFANYFFLG